MRILVAEDSPGPRRLLVTRLTDWGYDVAVCADGAQALSALQDTDGPRLAILDWGMPGLSGPEVCREVRRRALPPYRYLILLTGRGAKADLVEGLEAGADDYLTKP
jgi:DNA-binding response OmpR family regulator